MRTIEQHFADWESLVFGYGYGSGEEFILPALRSFLTICEPNKISPETFQYNYRAASEVIGPASTWFLINTLCHADIIEYGTSPRHGWLSTQGDSLRKFVMSKSDDELVELATSRSEGDFPCYPDHCNCDDCGCKESANPFWVAKK